MRKKGIFLPRLLLIGAYTLFAITILNTGNVSAASNAEIITDNLARVPKSNELIDSDYSVIAKFNKGVTKLVYDGKKPIKNANNIRLFYEPKNSDKGSIQARYTNVSTYKGRSLDLRFTVKDWGIDPDYTFGGGENFWFSTTNIGFKQGGYKYVTLEMEYLYSATGEPADDIKGTYMTFSDLDMHQSIAMTENELDKIHDMHVYKNTWVHTWKDGNKTHIGSVDFPNLANSSTIGNVTVLIDSHKLTFDWSKDYSGGINLIGNYGDMQLPGGNRVYSFKPMDIDRIKASGSLYHRTKGDISQELFSYTAVKQLRTETVEPSKTINDEDGEIIEDHSITYPDTEYAYNIHHTVPYETPSHFYDSYIIKDDIHEMLDIKGVKVYNFVDDDVSNLFNISIDGNIITTTAKDTTLNKQDFYGQDYRVEIQVELKDLEDQFAFAKAKGTFNITNDASVTVNNHTKTSNTVQTEVNLPKTEIGFDKIQIITNKANEGLPVNVDINIDNYYDTYKSEVVGIEIRDSSNNVVQTEKVSLSSLENTINLEIPSSKLVPNSEDNYKAVIADYNDTYIGIIDDTGEINTDGYTSAEKNFDVEVSDTLTYKGVIMTERKIKQNMKKYHETFVFDNKSLEAQKTGYGFEINSIVEYKNDLKGVTEIDLKSNVDNKLIDSYLNYPSDSGFTTIEMDRVSSEKSSDEKIHVYKFQLPHVNVENGTGYLFTDRQVSINDSKITNELKSGGRKLYVPIWADLKTYKIYVQSSDPIGVNQIMFNAEKKLDVYAYMFATIGSDTIAHDEILVEPINPEDPFPDGIPEGWSQSDLDWLNE